MKFAAVTGRHRLKAERYAVLPGNLAKAAEKIHGQAIRLRIGKTRTIAVLGAPNTSLLRPVASDAADAIQIFQHGRLAFPPSRKIQA